MRRRGKFELSPEDRREVTRWWRIMISAVAIVVLVLLAAEKAHQWLVPAMPSLVQEAAK
jgi:succinate dehydrogenase hydrophobic anchor subunit